MVDDGAASDVGCFTHLPRLASS